MANIDDALSQGAADWLALVGDIGTYHGGVRGLDITMHMHLDKDAEVVDSYGAFIKRTIVSFPSQAVDPHIADKITLRGNKYRVDEIVDDPGHITRVFVSRI